MFGCFYKLRTLFLAPWPWRFLQLALSLGGAAAGSRAVTEAFVEAHRPCSPCHSQNEATVWVGRPGHSGAGFSVDCV